VWSNWITNYLALIWEQRLRAVKYSLKDWAKINYPPLELEKIDLRWKMDVLQGKMETNTITKDILNEESQFFQKYHKVL
jgi:hypothetical protein